MGFNQEGRFNVKIVDAYLCEPRFPAKQGELNNANQQVVNYGDLCLELQDEHGNVDYWYGELSNRNGKFEKNCHLSQTSITLMTLVEIGFNTPTWAEFVQQLTEDSSVPNLINFEVTAVTKRKDYPAENGYPARTRYFVSYITKKGAGAPARISKAEILKRMQAPMGVPALAMAPAPASAPMPAPVPTPIQNPY